MASLYAIIGRRTMRFVAGAALVMTLTACDKTLTFLAGEDWQTGTVYTKTHWNGDESDAPVQATVIARTQGEWEDLWARTGKPAPGLLPPTKMGVAVFIGQRPTQGWRVDIARAGKELKFGQSEQFMVRYRVKRPDKNAVLPQVVTSPWAIRLTNHYIGNVEFDEEKE